MSAQVLAFAAGVLALQLQAGLPAPAWLWLLPVCALMVRWAPYPARLCLCAAIGFLWAAGFAH